MTHFAWFDTTFCERLTLTLAHFIWQGLVIAFVVLCVGRLLNGRSAAARYRVFVVALLLMTACPLATYCLLESTRPALAVDNSDAAFSSADGERSSYSAHVDTLQGRTEPDLPTVRPVPQTPSVSETKQDVPAFVFQPDTAGDGESLVVTATVASSGDQLEKVRVFHWRSYASLATLVYLAGALAMLVRLAMGVYGGGRLRRRSSPVDDPSLEAVIVRRARALGLRFSPAVAYCQQIAIPTVIGVLRPTILLPLSVASGLNPTQLEAILAHELAHIRRYDYLVNLIQRLIEAMLFFHPAVWLVSRRIRVERERCCDDLVLATGAEPLSYASSLLKAAELGRASRGSIPAESAVAMGATSQPSELVDRIRRLVEGESCQPVRLRHPWVSLLCTAVVFAAGSFLVLHLNVQTQSAGGSADEPATTQDVAATHADDGDATIKRLLPRLRDEDWYFRWAVAYELSKISDKALVDPFIETLNDERSEVRRAAARGLGNIGDARAVEPLVAALKKAEHKFEIEAIVCALSEIGDPDTIDPIVEAIGRSEPAVDFYSVRSILRFRDPRIADLLLGKVRTDGGGFHFNVVSMLVQLKEPRLLEPLLEYLASSNSRKSWRAADALGRFGDPRAVEPLIAALDDSDHNMREAAAKALGELGDARAVEPLVRLLKKEREDDVLQRAARALSLLGDERALEALKPLASHDDRRVRDVVTRAIADIELGATRTWRAGGGEQAIELAESALKSGGEPAAWAATRALGRIGGPQAAEALVRSVKDPRTSVRSSVIDALAQIESDGAADGLVLALNDEDAENQWKAATALARREDGRAIETLISFAQNGHYWQRRHTAESLGDLGDPVAVQPLCDMLNDSERQVRDAAARALHDIAHPQALDSLLKALETEEDNTVRARLVIALGQICDPRAIQALVDVLADPEPRVRLSAARMLPRLGWKPSTDLQRIRFMMASGRAHEADGLIPKAEVVGDKNRLAGKFELNKPTLTPLTVGTGRWPVVLMFESVEFREQADELVAIVQLSKYSWPTSSWCVSVQLLDEANKVVANGEMTVKTSGTIISQRLWEFSQPHKLKLGRVDDLARVRRFEFCVHHVPDDRLPPSPVEITEPAEAPLALAKDAPVKLEARNPDGRKVVWAQKIRFDQTAEDEKKKELKATLLLQWASLRKADWRVWLILLDEEGKVVSRSTTASFSTEHIVKGLPKVADESLEMRMAIWKVRKEPVRFRVGLELTKDHTKTAFAQQSIPEGVLQLTHVDDTAEGKRSIAASGHAVRFERPDDATYVEAIRIFASRYGDAKPPDEDFHVYVLNENHQVLADLRFPYSTIERGERCWYTLRTPSIEVPQQFLVALSFNPHRRKGIYLGYDNNVEQSHSLVGLPADGFEPVKESYDWMVSVHLSGEPSGKKGTMRLADWKPPVHVDPFQGCIEARYDTGQSDGKQSYGGSGPAVRFKLTEVLPGDASLDDRKLAGFRLYASRYGSGFDAEQTMLKVAVLGRDDKTLWQGTFPYALFGYKAKWIDFALPEPLAFRDSDLKDGSFTVAIDPEANRYKGIYFHYNKAPEVSHSLSGTVARGFRKLPDREWMIRAWFNPKAK